MTLTLENKRLIFVGGKGGVGKTTSSAAIALHLSERSQCQRILLFSTDPAHSISDSFNTRIGDTPTQITNTLDGIEINVEELTDQFKGRHKEAIQELLTRAASLDKKDTEHALELAIPGIDEFMSLMKLSSLIENSNYKTIVVDTAPTGHTLKLLSTPSGVNSWLMFFSGLHSRYKTLMRTFMGADTNSIDGFMTSLSEGIYNVHTLITDTEKTEFIIVTIPDLMAVEETKRLYISLYSEGIKVNNMIINSVQTNIDCPFCQSRRNYQNRYIDIINATYPQINKIYIPLFPNDINGITYLKAFKDILFS